MTDKSDYDNRPLSSPSGPGGGNINNWEQWAFYVLNAIQRHEANVDKIMSKIEQIEKDVSTLMVKASIFGSLFGIISAAVSAFINAKLGTGH